MTQARRKTLYQELRSSGEWGWFEVRKQAYKLKGFKMAEAWDEAYRDLELRRKQEEKGRKTRSVVMKTRTAKAREEAAKGWTEPVDLPSVLAEQVDEHRRASRRQEMEWVYHNLMNDWEVIQPKDVPSRGAVALLRWAKQNPGEFFKRLLPDRPSETRTGAESTSGPLQRVEEFLNDDGSEEVREPDVGFPSERKQPGRKSPSRKPEGKRRKSA